MKIIRIILSAIVIILAVTVIVTEASTAASVTPYMLASLGILNLFSGIYFYRENKKTKAIMMLLIGLFVIFVSIFILLTPVNLVK